MEILVRAFGENILKTELATPHCSVGVRETLQIRLFLSLSNLPSILFP